MTDRFDNVNAVITEFLEGQMRGTTGLKARGLIVSDEGTGTVRNVQTQIPCAPVFALHSVKDIRGVVATLDFLKENADKTVILDAADFFTTARFGAVERQTMNDVAFMLKGAVDPAGDVPGLITLPGFKFTGKIVITTHDRRYIWEPLSRYCAFVDA